MDNSRTTIQNNLSFFGEKFIFPLKNHIETKTMP